ncbi:MAG: histidine kinase [Bacteroidota bacterium]
MVAKVKLLSFLFFILLRIDVVSQDLDEQLQTTRTLLSEVGAYGNPELVDSLYRQWFTLAEKIPDYRLLARGYLQYANLNIGIRLNMDTAAYYLKKGERLASKYQLEVEMARYNIYQAYYYNLLNEHDRCILYMEAAKRGVSEIKDTTLLFYLKPLIYEYSADFYRVYNMYDSALSNYQSSVRWSQRYGRTKNLFKSLNKMATLAYSFNDYQRSKLIYAEVILFAYQNDAEDVLTSAYKNLADILVIESKYDSAKILFKKSLDYKLKNNNPIHSTLTALANLHAKQGQSDSSLIYLNLFDTTSARRIDKYEMNKAYATAYLVNNEIDSALAFNRRAESLAEERNIAGWMRDVLMQRVEILEKKKDYSGAFSSMKDLKVIEDSLLNMDKQRSLQELQTRFDFNRKQQEIESLAQENEIKDLELNQRNIIIIGITIVLLAVLIIAVLLMRQNKSNAEKRQMILEQTVLRTQMNPHFIFNALASIQNFVLNDDRDKATIYIAKFGELTRDVLEVSKNEFITLKKEINMVQNYVDLEGARFNKDLSLVIMAEKLEIDNLLVPPMIIQPFLENSIKHGFDGRESGIIEVSILKEKNELLFKITDDGIGLHQEYDKNSQSIGLNLVKERISRLQKDKKDYIFEISNKYDQQDNISGVVVIFNLPVKNAI